MFRSQCCVFAVTCVSLLWHGSPLRSQIPDDRLTLTVVESRSTPQAITLVYNPAIGHLSVDTGGEELTLMGIESTGGWFDATYDNCYPYFRGGLFDVCTSFKLFEIWPEGLSSFEVGPILPADLTADQLLADITVYGNLQGGVPINEYVATSPHLFIDLQQGIFRWDNGQVIAGTEGIVPGSGLDLSQRTLAFAYLTNVDLTGTSFQDSDLSDARFMGSNLTNVDFRGASIARAVFEDAEGFTAEQLLSTQSYATKQLSGVNLRSMDLDGADLHEQDLSTAVLIYASLQGANLNHANLTRARLHQAQMNGADLGGANLAGAVLPDANLAQAILDGANLSSAHLSGADLTNASLSGAIISDGDFSLTRGFRAEQLYSTKSYQNGDLAGIELAHLNLANWNFAGQDLSQAWFQFANLTGAELTGARLAEARLYGANLRMADLSDTVGLQTVDFGDDSPGIESKATYDQWTRFPVDFDPERRGLRFVASMPGDVNGDDFLNRGDIDLVTRVVRGQQPTGNELRFDLDENGVIDLDDHRFWVQEVKHTWFG
ncbi:MAG: pentapeptide repeat-containing protein, partial [Planctomycetales bacterium]|nr:pentapeptide repeat-containing protein [Planctomycetales bacterium]